MTFPVSEIMDRLRQVRDGWLRSHQERRLFPDFEVPDQPGAALTGLPDGLHVDVFFFDPVARAGLYAEWQASDGHTERTEEAATDFPAEIPAGGIAYSPDDSRPGELVLSFPDVEWWTPSARGGDAITHRPKIECFPVDDNGARALQPVDREEVEEGEAERFVLSTPGRYVVYIWLRPRTIVLHWTVGPYVGGAAARRSYHFLVDDGGTWIPAGRTDQVAEMRPSWRMWWHNLRLLGVPNLRRRQGVDLRLNRRQPGGSFGGANNVIGYFVHAQGFHLNTAAVAFTGMRGAPDVWGSTSWGYPVEVEGREVTRWQSRDAGQRWQPFDADGEPIQDHWQILQRVEDPPEEVPDHWDTFVDEGRLFRWRPQDPTPLTEVQVLKGLRQVAALCRAWELDPMDFNQLCTHAEVDRIHRNNERKWDIIWLPRAIQERYAAFIAQYVTEGRDSPEQLCENDDGRLTRRNDMTLHGVASAHRDGLPADVEATDRVGDFLRRIVKGMMDCDRILDDPGIFDDPEVDIWEDEEVGFSPHAGDLTPIEADLDEDPEGDG
jgi:hypothetical protein